MSDSSLYLGLDIGGTKCAAVVGSRDGQIIDRLEWPSNASRGASAMLGEIQRHATSLIQTHPTILATGVSIGGPMDAVRGIIHSPPNLPGWDSVPLKQILEEQLKLPARIEHDAAACCLAEYHWGAGQGDGRDASRLIYLTCGTGFGAGMVFDGEIYRGADGRSAEVGHVRLRDDGPEAYGKRGSAEALCAASALGKIAAWRFRDRWPVAPSSKEIADLAKAGDAQAIDVIQLNATAVGDVCAMLGDLLRPTLILLGSLAQYLGSGWVKQVRDRFDQEVLPDTAAACRIEPAALGARLQDCSALVVAVNAVKS